MKKIDTTDYMFMERNIEVKKSIVAILFHPQLDLDYLRARTNDKLAKKIEECTDDTVLLENSEYDTLAKAVRTLRCYTRENVELIDRILDVETVEVQEKPDAPVLIKKYKE